ncbi:MAG: dethiobiotin synthase [Methylococcales bacterium]|nr:dethiobiotin synthase [Methylococcales bacterium]
MKQAYFITGTDTNAGKTIATIALLHYFKRLGKTVIGMKPVAAGCVFQAGRLCNDDALLMQEHSSMPLDYSLINPYPYELAVSPHLAGHHNPVNLATIAECFDVLKPQAEVILVEGAGGWFAPLNGHEAINDLAQALALPIILVVGIRLGCINHAKLTYLAICQSGLACAGWIAVCVDPDMQMPGDNIATIKLALDVPLLGVLPFMASVDFEFLAGQLVL